MFFSRLAARVARLALPCTTPARRGLWRRVLLVGIAASFCGSIGESLLPDPCPSDCSAVITGKTLTLTAADADDRAPQSPDHSLPSGPSVCHCGHTHVTQLANRLAVPATRVAVVGASSPPHYDFVADHGRAAPPVPPPLV